MTLQVPWQQVKPLVKDVGIRARNKAAAKARTMLANTAEIDTQMYLEAKAKFDQEQGQCLECVATLSAWTQDKKEQIGQAATTSCPHCGKEGQDMVHTIWTCEILGYKLEEADHEIINLARQGKLPSSLLLGIPPAMDANFDNSFWGRTLDDFDDCQKPCVGQVLMESHACSNVRESVRQTLEQNSQCLNARQVIQQLRGGHTTFRMSDITPCQEAPPEEPNVYSDGSLKNPRNWYWGMGGYGLVWKIAINRLILSASTRMSIPTAKMMAKTFPSGARCPGTTTVPPELKLLLVFWLSAGLGLCTKLPTAKLTGIKPIRF